MRIIEGIGGPVRTAAISPDGRLIAVSVQNQPCAIYDWVSGAVALPLSLSSPCDQFAFPPNNTWMAYAQRGDLWFDNVSDPAAPMQLSGGFAGGVAVSPDGKLLVAVQDGEPRRAKLARWSLPSFRPVSGFDDWSPCRKLTFSPNGEFLAGILPGARRGRNTQPALFELRFAASGGVDRRYPTMDRPAYDATGFVSFARDSGTCVFGWEGEFHVLDISTGTSRHVRRVEASFRDAAFVGSGPHFATVGDDGLLKLWDPRSWQVAREYDWGCGPLTCVAFSADGLAGVCGTTDGRLVQFDVDE